MIVSSYLGALVGIVLHELAHAVAATWQGDPSPIVAGRVTLNPIAHLTPVGSFIWPALSIALAGVAMGYARPVPVDARYFRDGPAGAISVYAAGPLTNFLLAGLLFILSLLYQPIEGAAIANLALGLLNLLPIYPLDGGRIFRTLRGIAC